MDAEVREVLITIVDDLIATTKLAYLSVDFARHLRDAFAQDRPGALRATTISPEERRLDRLRTEQLQKLEELRESLVKLR